MAKLTPMLIKKKKMEEALAGKKSNDSKLLFEDAEDDSGSEDDHEDDGDDLEDDSDDIEMEGGDDDDDDDDEEDDEDDAPELVNKPAKKGAAKQQTPVKMSKTPLKLAKTPLAKTPVKAQTPVVAKQVKQTPVAAKKGAQTKEMEEEDEDEDEDDDEEMASDDDEEEEESSEGDEAEEEEDDDEEENGDVKKGGKKRPAEDDIESPPKKVKMTFDCSNQEIKAQYERLVELDNRSLFIRFQSGLSAEQIQAMSPDIKSVVLYNPGSGVISFDDEAAAEKNMKLLKAKSNDSNGLQVNYNGTKNGRQPFMGTKNVFALDRSKLTVTGLPDNISTDDLNKAFPKCAKAELSAKKGFIKFSSEEDCKEAFESGLDLAIGGQKVGVMYSFISMPNYSGSEKSGSFSPRGRGRGSFNGSEGFRGGRGRGGFRGGRGGSEGGFRGGRGSGEGGFRGGRGRGGSEGFRGGRGRGEFRGGRGQRGGGFRGGRGRVVADN